MYQDKGTKRTNFNKYYNLDGDENTLDEYSNIVLLEMFKII